MIIVANATIILLKNKICIYRFSEAYLEYLIWLNDWIMLYYRSNEVIRVNSIYSKSPTIATGKASFFTRGNYLAWGWTMRLLICDRCLNSSTSDRTVQALYPRWWAQQSKWLTYSICSPPFSGRTWSLTNILSKESLIQCGIPNITNHI